MATQVGDTVAFVSRPKPHEAEGHYRNGHASGSVTIWASTWRNNDVFMFYVRAEDGCEFWVAPWEIATQEGGSHGSAESDGA